MTERDLERLASYIPDLAGGLAYTILLTPLAMSLATLLGVLFAVALNSRLTWLRRGVQWFIAVARSIPELVHVFLWYEALAIMGLVLPALVAGVSALAVVFGAFLGEVIRASILSVEPTQWESGQVLGMSRATIWRRVILPQAMRNVLPVWSSYYVSMYKATALLGLITVPDLLFRARGLATQNFRVFEIYLIVLIIYFIVGTLSLRIIRWYERRLRVDFPKAEARDILRPFPEVT
ncbi:ectoine/hydroxyectoine ABC transporter permease subunit EhuD [soil metagenome]